MRPAWSLQERQRQAVVQMLQLQSPEAVMSPVLLSDEWKVLVYDSLAQEILGPLLKVGGLRQHGVTLHLPLATERTPVPEAPAVYLMAPTTENLHILIKDIEKKCYHKYYVNFTSAITRQSLELLARKCAEMNAAAQVAQVCDRHLRYIALSSFEFHLGVADAYRLLFSRRSSEGQIEALLSTIVDGLFSVCMTLKSIPVIRCPAANSSPANMVGTRLHSKLKGFFESSTDSNFRAPRVLLILTDRDVDLSIMVKHVWQYQALIHDLFTIKVNRVSIPNDPNEPATSGTVPATLKTYDLDMNDELWTNCASKAFPEAAVAISEALTTFNEKKKELTGSSSDVASALDLLPEMTGKKRSLDAQTNIASAVVAAVTRRGLDRLFEAEDKGEGFKEIEKLLKDPVFDPMDKLRTLITFALGKHASNTPANVDTLVATLSSSGAGPVRAVKWIQQVQQYRSMAAGPAPGVSPLPGGEEWRTQLIDRSRGLLEGVKNLLPVKRELPLTKLVAQLSDPHGTDVPNFLYLDPKATAIGASESRVRLSLRQIVTFVIGGGSFVEARDLFEWAGVNDFQLIYGATDFDTPTLFTKSLELLGEEVD